MALMGHDGETHSHLRPGQPTDGQGIPGAAGEEMPARGYWVGPRAGDPATLRTKLPENFSVTAGEPLPAMQHRAGDSVTAAIDARAREAWRTAAHGDIRMLLKHQPMVEEQRHILTEALGVLDSFA
jgi:hypothetical protein